MGGVSLFLTHQQIYDMTPLELGDYNIAMRKLKKSIKQAKDQSEKEAKRKRPN